MLISRTQTKLEAAANEIGGKYKVDVQVVAADFSALKSATLASIQKTISTLDVGLLVNNVGMSYDHAEYLDAIEDTLIDDLVQINVVAATKARLQLNKHSSLLLANMSGIRNLLLSELLSCSLLFSCRKSSK